MTELDVRDALRRVATVFQRYRLRWRDEIALHDLLEQLLREGSVACEREHRLVVGAKSVGTVDFYVTQVPEVVPAVRLGLEVKVQGAFADVLRQLQRYALSGCLDGILLVSTRSTLAARMPDSIGGIPLETVVVGSFLSG